VKQTPSHDRHNPDLLKLMDRAFGTLVEVGCSRGALARARAYRQIYPDTRYIGVEIEPEDAAAAAANCSQVVRGDIEQLAAGDWGVLFPSDCWVFGDSLEHLRDPWGLLRRVREGIAADGQVVACIPNAQHWSMQARLSTGLLRYEEQGLLDRTHLRWFTRVTILELFQSAGFKVVQVVPRVFEEPARERLLPSIRALAAAAGADPEAAARDALALQYVVRALPA
jgi:hypothetical protein